jgi:ribosome-binding protein aMBF1 (putative translation factor)
MAIVDDLVDAIEDGKIVKVTESYAKREGLMILRRQTHFEPDKLKSPGQINQYIVKEDPLGRRGREPLNLDKLRRPLDYRKNNIVADLKDNFHWEISRARKARGITRKQLADALATSEEAIKMIENGVLPSNDFVLISKLEKYFGLNLRKSGGDFDKPMLQKALGTDKKEVKNEKKEENISQVDMEFS